MRPALRSTSCLALFCRSWCETYAETAMPAANTTASTMLNLSLRPIFYLPCAVGTIGVTSPILSQIRAPCEPRHLAFAEYALATRRSRDLLRSRPLGYERPARAARGALRGRP